MDRIDLLIEVPALKEDELTSFANAENSESIRNRVENARETQLKRQGKANFALGNLEIDEHCLPDDAGMTLLKDRKSVV